MTSSNTCYWPELNFSIYSVARRLSWKEAGGGIVCSCCGNSSGGSFSLEGGIWNSESDEYVIVVRTLWIFVIRHSKASCLFDSCYCDLKQLHRSVMSLYFKKLNSSFGFYALQWARMIANSSARGWNEELNASVWVRFHSKSFARRPSLRLVSR